ncbi:DUF3784 domain-containing protein [Oceanobacillus locisalsi]|uniref:DUF3784 domain-containing protein n=1 Tax=Oceanobacillus locisalsi TaxID=546107 RepID=A0ABW3NG02_9BACI
MGMELGIGLSIGALLIWAGYIVRTKQVFTFIAGFRESWEPVNKERLGNRIGTLLVILGFLAVLTSIFTIWFGAAAGKISGIIAIIDVILVIIAIGLDQIGY